MDLQFKGKHVLKGKIECLTGLHIGGMTEGIEIGGLDNPVTKDPLTELPYIPGSSLKGKLRSLLEWALGLIEPHQKHKGAYVAYECSELKSEQGKDNDPQKWERTYILGRLFGPASDDTNVRMKAGPTRLTIRDAFPTGDTKMKWEEWLGEEVYTEIKVENTLDRITSEATPRPMERVPKGSEFAFEMIIDQYQSNEQEVLLRHLFMAMHLLENTSLGGSGSRGYGEIRFKDLGLEWRSLEYYKNGGLAQLIGLPGKTPKEILEQFDKIEWKE
ncbi:MAG: CRISPR type III-associated RAMP protein Csm3 [Syntrophomonadaceae bacterium]|nr:CRISPR type III-associated RAMP protein Csm3 [Bacillota bacterium]MBT9146867.1 CRISPR type III-associated RAMP protein Csm3 [Bacillota bacterium]